MKKGGGVSGGEDAGSKKVKEGKDTPGVSESGVTGYCYSRTDGGGRRTGGGVSGSSDQSGYSSYGPQI